MSADALTVRNIARRYVDWLQKTRENPLPKVVQPAAAKAEELLKYRPMDESHKQDLIIQENRERIESMKRQVAEQSAAASPRDGGEIDGPSPVVTDPSLRQPIQMQREFSKDEDKEAYLERIRQAQKNAASGGTK